MIRNLPWVGLFYKKRESPTSCLQKCTHDSRYLIVDYERSNFSVSQNSWVENAPQHIIPIKSINSTSPPSPQHPKSSGISIGAIVGIIVAAVVLLIFAAVAAFFIIRRRRKKREAEKKKEEEEDDPYRKPEMDGNGKPPIGELYTEGKLGEVDSTSKVEVQGSQPDIAGQVKANMAEVEGSRGGAEVEGTTGGAEMEGSHLRAEMAGDHYAPVELDAGPQGLYEMPSPGTSNSELPSPLSPSSEGRSGLSPTWSRRQKPTPRLPDTESSDTATDSDPQGRRNGPGFRPSRPARGPQRSRTPNDVSSPSSNSSERRPNLPSPNLRPSQNSDSRGLLPDAASLRDAARDTPTRTSTPREVSSQSSGSRERQRRPSNGLDRRMGPNRGPPLGQSSTSDQILRRADSGEEGNRRFASRERSLTPRSPDTRSPGSPGGIESWERRPSPLGNNVPLSGSPRAGPQAQGGPRERSPIPPGGYF